MLDDIFDNLYFDDTGDVYHNVKLDFRLSKENIINLSGFFEMLKSELTNKTTYIRNLLNEYINKKDDDREWLYFKQEFDIVWEAIDNHHIVYFEYEDEQHALVPVDIDLNYLTRSAWFIGVEESCAKAFQLRKMENISIGTDDIEITEEQHKRTVEYISEYNYIKTPILSLEKMQ